MLFEKTRTNPPYLAEIPYGFKNLWLVTVSAYDIRAQIFAAADVVSVVMNGCAVTADQLRMLFDYNRDGCSLKLADAARPGGMFVTITHYDTHSGMFGFQTLIEQDLTVTTDGILSLSGDMVDNEDPLNPVINHDTQKLDVSTYTEEQSQIDGRLKKAEASLDAVEEQAGSLNMSKQDKLSGAPGQIVVFDAKGIPVAQDAPDTGVISFNGRMDAVAPEAGDYTAEMVGAIPMPQDAAESQVLVYDGERWSGANLSDVAGEEFAELAAQAAESAESAELSAKKAQETLNSVTERLGNAEAGVRSAIQDAKSVQDALEVATTTADTAQSDLAASTLAANTAKDDLDASIQTGHETQDALDASNAAAETTKVALDKSISAGESLLKDLSSKNTEANSTKEALNNSITIGSNTKDTLDDIVSSSNTTKDALESASKNAVEVQGVLETATSAANTARTALLQPTEDAQAAKSALDSSISASRTIKEQLDDSNITAQATKSDLEISTTIGNSTKAALDDSISTGGTTRDGLEAAVLTANTATGDLNVATQTANTVVATLEQHTEDANTAKDDLETATGAANTAKDALQKPTTDAQEIKTALDTANQTAEANIEALTNADKLAQKITKVSPATAGNLAALTTTGELSDSGKKPDDFAPSGYGLGMTSGQTVSDYNTAVRVGFYALSGASTANAPPGDLLQYGTLLVERRGGAIIIQTAKYEALSAVRYSYDNGATWSEWEWINPPMAVGVEYRTTERWNGKPVYTKLVDCGLSAHNKTIDPGLSSYTWIRAEGSSGAMAIPSVGSNHPLNDDWDMGFLASGSIRLYCGSSRLNRQTYVQVWYTK